MAAPSWVDYTIGGVKIQFPCKAYPSQLTMMNFIVRGLNNGQNCLLESPTGSGKSLALLCSTLGWQQAQYLKLQHGGTSEDEKSHKEKSGGDLKKSPTPCQCVCHNTTKKSSPAEPGLVIDLTQSPCKETKTQASANVSPSEDPKPKRHSIASRLSKKLQSSLPCEAEKDDDFQPDRKRIRTTEPKSRKKPRLEKGVIFLDDEPEFEDHTLLNQSGSDQHNIPGTSHSPAACAKEVCTKCPCDFGEEIANKKPKVPKIFFGTRTHKQIKQIAHELKRTLYCSAPMTILSSRDHSCVNATVAPHANRNERCKDLREAKEGSCRYYHNVHKMRDHSTVQWVHGLRQAWDIEELVSLGKRIKACSYYAARELMQTAQIVFCPYNYLLDPLIRSSMEINLDGQIVVLDEAHNIEDCARESASYTLDLQSLTTCKDEIESLISVKIRPTQHKPLQEFCYSLINWIRDSQSLMSEREYESASKVWNGKEVVDIFKDLGITPDTFAMLKSNLMAVMEKEEKVKDGTVELPTISSASSTVLESVFMVLDFLYRDKSRFADDYRVALQKSYTWTNQAPPDVPDANGFIARRHRGRQNVRVKTEVLSLSFWCLNPAVAFSDLSKTVHSIVLTSGTLSPMGSFSSELGVEFPIQLEAKHVIDTSQVWVGTVGAGPQGRTLRATFKNIETYTFQDEVGELLLHVCRVVSKGVLCFFSSYKMLDKLQDRWMNTGLWDKLENLKTVIVEPRGGGKGQFDELLQSYYDAIKYRDDHRDGALLLAVCRGKVSEGLDFTDDNARAVVTIGIPYPSSKDLQVELKMKYNDQHKTRGLLSGWDWFEIQAFRALNQALGRCIRHKNDWGALVLVDDRYKNNPKKYIPRLSKWVRQLVHHHDTFPSAMQSLVAFSHRQKLKTEGGCAEGPSAPSSSSNLGMNVLMRPLTPLSVVNTSELHKSPPAIHTNAETDLKTAFEPLYKPNRPCQPLYPIFTSSPENPCFKKPIFKEKGTCNSTCTAETSTSPRPQSSTEDYKIDNAYSANSENKTANGHVESKDVMATNGAEPVGSSDEEDETVFFTPELFEDDDETGSQQKEPCSLKPEELLEQQTSVNNAVQSGAVVRAEETGKDRGKEAGGMEEAASQSKEADSKLRRLSRSKKSYSSIEGN